ncbi:MAG: LamG domain-containing protein [Planctomycetota bacterium]|nr:LamG domain-containing protein [Planctomycetota bacterium]
MYWGLLATQKSSTTGTMVFNLTANTLKTVTANVDFAVGDWVFVVGTYNKDAGGAMKLYQNGVLVGSATNTGYIAHDSTVPMFIGALGGGGMYWKGTIDEVMMFNTELTDTQIKTLYAKRWADTQYAAWSN